MKKLLLILMLVIYSICFCQDGTIDKNYGLIYMHPGYQFETVMDYGVPAEGFGKTISSNSYGDIIVGMDAQKRTTYSAPLEYSFGTMYTTVSSNSTSIDNYGGGGYKETCQASVALPSGKFFIAGYKETSGGLTDLLMQRYNANGTRDNTLNGNGKSQIDVFPFEEISSMKMYAGKIYAFGRKKLTSAGSFDAVLWRFTENGELDKTFNGIGYKSIGVSQLADCKDFAFQSDGKIVFIAEMQDKSEFLVYRLNTNGTTDTSFGTYGTPGISRVQFTDVGDQIPVKILVGDDDAIFVGGSVKIGTNYAYGVVKLNKIGKSDVNFATNGMFVRYVNLTSGGEMRAMKILKNNTILLAGNLYGYKGIGLMRLTENGALDYTFGVGGISQISKFDITNVEVRDFIIKPNNKILVTGSAVGYAPNNKNTVFLAQINNSYPEQTLHTQNISLLQPKIANPVKDFLNIQTTQKIDKVEVYAATGQLVKTFKTKEANVSDLAKGMYIVKLYTDNGVSSQKIIKE